VTAAEVDEARGTGRDCWIDDAGTCSAWSSHQKRNCSASAGVAARTSSA
jgi:hypothetical protein